MLETLCAVIVFAIALFASPGLLQSMKDSKALSIMVVLGLLSLLTLTWFLVQMAGNQ